MRICIFSDIHGNIDALNGMLAADGDADYFIFAGDIFGYFYEQKKIIDWMQNKKNIFAVRGNHDDNFLNSNQKKQQLIDKYGSSYCTVLSKEQSDYIEGLPEYLEVEIGGKLFGIFHGGFDDYLNQRIYPDSEINMQSILGKYDYVILGHTHYRFLRIEKDVMIINPGSLGQPRDGKGFSYCILNTDDDSCEFKEVNVDIECMLEEVRKNDSNRTVCKYLYDKYGGAI